MSEFPTVAIGKHAHLRSESQPITAGTSYDTMGVRWYGRGAYMRPPSRPRTKTLNVAREGDFVFCRIDSQNGPFAVVPQHLDGALVTNEFPCYRTDPNVLDAHFLRMCFLHQGTLDKLGRLRDGRDGRARWKEADFEAWEIPLPPPPVQRCIVEVMAAVDEALDATRDEADRLAEVLLNRRNALTDNPEHPSVKAEAAFDIQLGRQRSPERATGPMMTKYLRSANIGHDQLRLGEEGIFEMDFNERERERYSLQNGDVLVSEGSAGADAVGMPAAWHEELDGPVCYQNTLLRYRAKEGVTSPEFVRHWCLWAYESGAFRNVVPPGVNILHIGSTRAKAMPMRLPDADGQQAIVDELDPLTDAVVSLRAEADRLAEARAALLDALLTQKVEVTIEDE